MNDYSRVSSNQFVLIFHSAKAYAEATDQVTASYQVAPRGPVMPMGRHSTSDTCIIPTCTYVYVSIYIYIYTYVYYTYVSIEI